MTGNRLTANITGAATVAAWLLSVLWLAWWALEQHTGFGCDAYYGDNSSWGTPTWGWLPPGSTCTYVDDAGPRVVVPV
ncbi:hypothetical protein ACSTJV_24090, partial [Vibrio parahaemolyticus]